MSFTLETRVCPLCHTRAWSREFSRARYDADRLDPMSFSSRKDPQGMHFRFLECTACDVLYASPVPAAEALAVAYREAEYESAIEARYAADTYARVLDGVLPLLPDRRGAVDIGAGDGAFLERLVEAGFDKVVGFEPSNAPRETAHPSVAPFIRPEAFLEGVLPECSASLISCLQTIEHVPDPVGLCTDSVRVLAPGGALLVICHDRRALPARILRHRSPIFDIEHLQLFSERSVRSLLVRSGLQRVDVNRLTNTYPVAYWLRMAPLPRRLKSHLQRVIGERRLAHVPVSLRAGNLVAIGYRPTG